MSLSQARTVKPTLRLDARIVPDRRRHKRIAVLNKTSTLKLADGSTADCSVLDVSLSGASIGTDARPQIGDVVMFGKLRCKVMRYHDRGIGVQFLDIPDPEALRRYFG
jgi:hypothetical protein